MERFTAATILLSKHARIEDTFPSKWRVMNPGFAGFGRIMVYREEFKKLEANEMVQYHYSSLIRPQHKLTTVTVIFSLED
ncbi:hypothetical protein WG66_005337 [Moniliophthora roreri]|nr:hypothetical protein WG66_005337 [Moniliophthora roreri]